MKDTTLGIVADIEISVEVDVQVDLLAIGVDIKVILELGHLEGLAGRLVVIGVVRIMISDILVGQNIGILIL